VSPESMRSRFVSVTADMLDADPRLVLVLADISLRQFREAGVLIRHPDRVINAGIREQLIVSIGGGMALEGFRPIVHSYAPFLIERAFEQVKLDFGHQGVGGILVSIGASYDSPIDGRTHQAPEDVVLMASLPGWRIDVPGHPDEAEQVLREAARSDGSVYIRLSDVSNAEPLATGGIQRVRTGSASALTVLAVGPMLDPASRATADLDATLLYAATVRPFDAGGLRQHMTSRDLVLIEPYLQGTSAASVSEALSDRPHRLFSIGVPAAELRRYGTSKDHDRAHGLDEDGLRSRIRAITSGP
jgi:transketolase